MKSRSALQFVVIIGIANFFADFTYEGARGIVGPFLGSLGASAAIVGFVAGFAGDEFGGFGGGDGFASVAVCFALGEELQDGGFECGVFFSGAVAAAGFGAIFEDVPVAGVLFGPVEGALAGLAEFFFVRGGAVGFGFAVGHWEGELVTN